MNIKSLISTSVCGLMLAALPAQAGVHSNGYGQKPIAFAQPVPSACTQHTYCVPQTKWVPAHYEQVQKQVWIPGQTKKVWVGHFITQSTPGHNQLVTQNVFVGGQWKTSCQVIASPVPHNQLQANLRAQYAAFNKPVQPGTKFQGYGAFGQQPGKKGGGFVLHGKQGGMNPGSYLGNVGGSGKKGSAGGMSYGGGASKKKGGASW